MCSAHSIRFWSLSCQVHSTHTLLSHSELRSSSLKYGITSIAIWKTESLQLMEAASSTTELIWFDVVEKQFHRAALQRQHASDCEYLLGIELNQTLDYRSNPFTNRNDTFQSEIWVKLAIDSDNQLLFASNFVQNRVDVYRLDSATAANNEMVWLASLDAHRPKDIIVDENEGTAFWLENQKKICYFNYRFNDEHFLRMERNLSSLKICTDELSFTPPYAITVDKKNKQIIWGSKQGKIYYNNYGFKNSTNVQLLGQTPEEADIHNLALNMKTELPDTLYLSDEKFVRAFQMDTHKFDLVSIESNTLFDILLVDNMTMTDTLHYSDKKVLVTDSTITTTTNTVSPELSFDLTVGHTTLPKKITNASLFTSTEPDLTSLNTIIFFTIVPIIFILIIVGAIIHIQKKNRPNSSCPSSLCFLTKRFSNHYNQLRKNRANSTGRDELIVIDDDDEIYHHHHHHHSHNDCRLAVNNNRGQQQMPPPLAHHYQGQQYRQNLIRQTSTIDDIEDIFGVGLNYHRPPPNTCIACRDLDICQDKGICMATYRVL